MSSKLSSNTRSGLNIVGKILGEVSKVVIGKDDVKEILLVALLCQGHVLIEGPTGTAKTTLAKTFAKVIGGEFKRIQFTPDMLPSDITGFYIYTPDGSSRFVPGPLFGNVVLADELNRTTPRTQAAMLEAMQERHITIDGNTHSLPTPFMVIASQLPYGAEGTYPLTEGQADRFMFRSWSEYLSKEVEAQIIDKVDYLEAPDIKPVVSAKEISGLQLAVQEIHVSEKIRDYIVTLIDHLRQDPDILLAPSTRASIALYKGARALAFLKEREFTIPDDVKRLISPALEHRIYLKPEAEMEDLTPKTVIARALEEVTVPKE